MNFPPFVRDFADALDCLKWATLALECESKSSGVESMLMEIRLPQKYEMENTVVRPAIKDDGSVERPPPFVFDTEETITAGKSAALNQVGRQVAAFSIGPLIAELFDLRKAERLHRPSKSAFAAYQKIDEKFNDFRLWFDRVIERNVQLPENFRVLLSPHTCAQMTLTFRNLILPIERISDTSEYVSLLLFGWRPDWSSICEELRAHQDFVLAYGLEYRENVGEKNSGDEEGDGLHSDVFTQHLDDLLTSDEIAYMIALSGNSIKPKHKEAWGEPEVLHRGRRPAKWKLRTILTTLREQFGNVRPPKR